MIDLTSFISNGTLNPLSNKVTVPTSLSANSKTVKEGGLFVAIPGTQHDGAAFIDEALRKGASAIVVQEIELKKLIHCEERYPTVSFFKTPNARKALSQLAAAFYPRQPENCVAVTGTNGKTSVVSFIRQIWHQLGIPAASLGTLGLIVEGKPHPPPTGTGGLNTPDPIALHEILQSLKQERIEHVAFEASSHALHQHRLEAVQLRAAVFTNLSNDHLDYHQTLEDYRDVKFRLFKEIVDKNGCAVLNADIPEFAALSALCQKRGLQTITFGKAGEDIQLLSVTPKEGAQDIHLCVTGKSYDLTLPLVGEFQVYNAMAAVGGVIACGADAGQAAKACAHLKGVPGRLEEVAPGIYVDYSHSPDGLSVALKALRPHTTGKLWVVFGCGGNRDTLKRPMMGEIADKLADKIIITDDNPRYENPAHIRQQIFAKCPRATESLCRRQAIQTAVEDRAPNDVILIAGKGHETYQIIGDQTIPFNDAEEVKRCIRAIGCK